jgi:hypothetical protein
MGRPRALALTVLCAAMLMIILDGTIVTVALPAIQRDLGFSSSGLAPLAPGARRSPRTKSAERSGSASTGPGPRPCKSAPVIGPRQASPVTRWSIGPCCR